MHLQLGKCFLILQHKKQRNLRLLSSLLLEQAHALLAKHRASFKYFNLKATQVGWVCKRASGKHTQLVWKLWLDYWEMNSPSSIFDENQAPLWPSLCVRIINTTAPPLVHDEEMFGIGTAEDASRQGINTSIWGSRNTAYQSYVWLISMLLIPCSHKSWAPSARLKKEKTSKPLFFFPSIKFCLSRQLSKGSAFSELQVLFMFLTKWLPTVIRSVWKPLPSPRWKLDAQLHFPRVSEWSPWLTK